MSREPFRMVRPDDHHQAPGRTGPLHFREAAVTAGRRLGGEYGACDDELGRLVGDRKRIEEPVDDANLCRLLTARRHRSEAMLEFPGEEFAQWGGGVNRGQLVTAADEVEGPPPAAGAAPDDSFHVIREPLQDIRMQALSHDETVVKLGLQAVEQLPGEVSIALRVGAVFDQQSTTITGRDRRHVFRRIPLEQLARANPISRPHCTRPSSSPFRTPEWYGGNSRTDAVAADPKTQPRDFPRSESGRATTGCRYSGCGDRPAR